MILRSTFARDLYPLVAVCFSGFLRNGALHRDVRRIFSPYATYDAFVVSPNERYELDHLRLVNGSDLCDKLTRFGFRRCVHRLQQYDPAVFFNATAHRCVYERGQYRLGLYPLRVASLVHGYDSCVDIIATVGADPLIPQRYAGGAT